MVDLQQSAQQLQDQTAELAQLQVQHSMTPAYASCACMLKWLGVWVVR